LQEHFINLESNLLSRGNPEEDKMENSLSERQRSEEMYHDSKYRSDIPVSPNMKEASAFKLFRQLKGNVRNLTILDYGCGNGWLSIDLVKEGAAEVYGIDISKELIGKACELAADKGMKEKIHFIKMPGENLTFSDNFFDLILGSAILHHTELDRAIKNLFRVLKPGGRAIFIEPLNQNIFLRIWRVVTPWRRSTSEKALLNNDLNFIRDVFPNSKYRFFKLISIFSTGLVIAFPNNKLLSVIDNFLEGIDSKLLEAFPSLGRYCAIVVLELTKD
jgi:ubiquinone/menaquinone biosynthesis C-methylase UbiE